MGMDMFQVRDFLDDKGIAEYNFELVVDYLKDPAYVNIIRQISLKQKQYAAQENLKGQGYEYFDPEMGSGAQMPRPSEKFVKHRQLPSLKKSVNN